MFLGTLSTNMVGLPTLLRVELIMLELLFASPHRSDLEHQRPCALHTKIQRYDVDYLVLLIYFRIVSYLFVVFVFCYLLISNIFGFDRSFYLAAHKSIRRHAPAVWLRFRQHRRGGHRPVFDVINPRIHGGHH